MANTQITTTEHDNETHAAPELAASGDVHGEIHLSPHTPGIAAETVFSVGSFNVTNSLIATWLIVILLIALGIAVRASIKKIPGKFQTFFEMVIEFISDLCDQITGNHALSKKISPIAVTVFLFILFNNWLGLLPGVGSIGKLVLHDGHYIIAPYLRGGTADVNTTLALSLFAVIAANIFGIIIIGFRNVANKYINIKIMVNMVKNIRKEPTQLIVAPITFFVGLLEIIGEIAKVASLSFRLFGNVFAGEVLLASMSAMVAFLVPTPFLLLEVMVGVIQAFIFTTLTVVYFTLAAQHHDDHSDNHEHAHA